MNTEKIDWLSVFDHALPFAGGLVMAITFAWFGALAIFFPHLTAFSPQGALDFGRIFIFLWFVAGAGIHLMFGMAALHPDSDRLIRQRYVMCAMGYTFPFCIPFIKKMWAAR